MELLTRACSLLAPPFCWACGADSMRADPLCPRCRAELRWLGTEPFDLDGLETWAPVAYEGPPRALVRALKFRGAAGLAGPMAAQIAALGLGTLLEDVPLLRDIATLFTLGGLIGGAVVYRAERAGRAGRELSATQVRQILFRWAIGGAIVGTVASLLAELL